MKRRNLPDFTRRRLLAQLYSEQHGFCAVCFEPMLQPGARGKGSVGRRSRLATLGHIVAASIHGHYLSRDPMDYVALHSRCNSLQGSMSLEEARRKVLR